MKALQTLLLILSFFIFTACDEKSNDNFKTIEQINEISQDKLTLLFLSKPGCKWCLKQKNDFKEKNYIKKYPQYDFIKIESDEKLFSQILKIKDLNLQSFPTLVLIQRDNQDLIILEKLEGYIQPDILEPFLEFNKDLLK
jgi:thioredoxin-related protein